MRVKIFILFTFLGLFTPKLLKADWKNIDCNSPEWNDRAECIANDRKWLQFPVNCYSPIWIRKPDCNGISRNIEVDVNIRGMAPNQFILHKLIPARKLPNTKIFYELGYDSRSRKNYDKDLVYGGCSLSLKCIAISSFTVKWSDFFIELQPYQQTCTDDKCYFTLPVISKKI